MRHRLRIFILLSVACVARGEDASKKSDMIAEMHASVDAIAKKYGNLPFTQIFTNEPARAAAVRKRFMEFEKMDSLQKQISDLEQKAARLNEELQAREAIASGMERKLTAQQLELQSAEADGVNRAQSSVSVEPKK